MQRLAPMTRAWFLVLPAAAVIVIGVAPAKAEPAEPRETMHEIFEAIQRAFPPSLSDERFRDPANRDRILAAFTTLADGGARLRAHGRGRDASFAFLSESLARDAEEIRRRYAAGWYDEARFGLHELTETCVACHSRLPREREHPLGARLMRDDAVAALPLDERARLEVATRQFDRALATHEALFAAPEVSPTALDLMGHLDDYLELALRVARDPERARATLQRFGRRDDLSPVLRANVAAWVATLADLEEPAAGTSGLAAGRAWIAEAEDRTRFPDERSALVLYVAASSILHRTVDGLPESSPETAEAYYLLGVTESRIGRTFWVSQTEMFLETAIRMAPGAPVARDAYDLLEEFLVAGYTGMSDDPLPGDVRIRLEELRQMIEGATAADA